MTINKIDNKGFTTQGPINSNVNTIISGNVILPSGNLQVAGPIGFLPRYEWYRSTGSQLFTGDTVHSVVRFNGELSQGQNGMHLWNTSSHIFQPTSADLGKTYTFRVDAIMSSSTGTPVFHMDFEVSGVLETAGHHSSTSLNRQAVDLEIIRGAQYDHAHFHAIFILLVDTQVVASGVHMYGAIDGSQNVTFKSGTLFIKEG